MALGPDAFNLLRAPSRVADLGLPAGLVEDLFMRRILTERLTTIGQASDALSISHAVGDEVLKEFPVSEPRPQPIHPGSFVQLENPLPADQPLAGLSLETWVRPWSDKGWQTLMSQHNYPSACGFGLFLHAGKVLFYLGDGTAYRADGALAGPTLDARRWQHVVGTWDGTNGATAMNIYINGQLQGTAQGPPQAHIGTGEITLGCILVNGNPQTFSEAVLDETRILAHEATAAEIEAAYLSESDQFIVYDTAQSL